MYSRAGQQGKGNDSCPEIRTTQKLHKTQINIRNDSK